MSQELQNVTNLLTRSQEINQDLEEKLQFMGLPVNVQNQIKSELYKMKQQTQESLKQISSLKTNL